MISKFLTIAEASYLIKKGDLSPVELVENKLQQIEKFDRELNSFVHVFVKEARNAAKIAEAEIRNGFYKGALHGIPIGVKDIYDMRGVPTKANSKIMQEYVADCDAYSIKKLKGAGAIILGKVATHEFALGRPSFGSAPRNPWDTTRLTGGSSSGTAAAVAGGLVLGGIGSDTAGSIRIPAAYCGLAGFKPTYGLISRSGILPLAFSLDHAGLMAFTVEDCAILLQTMAGYDPADLTSNNAPVPDYHPALNLKVKGLRVGLLRHFYTDDNKAEPITCDAIDNAAKKLEEIGCQVQEIQLSSLFDWFACGSIIMLAEAYAIHEANLRRCFNDYGESFRSYMALAALITGADYIQAIRRRRELINEFEQAMRGCDVILTATVRGEAPKMEEVRKFAIFERPLLTIPFNITGSPAVSVCCGYTNTGLPLSMQMIGKRFDDITVLRLANAYEQVTPWHKKRPAL